MNQRELDARRMILGEERFKEIYGDNPVTTEAIISRLYGVAQTFTILSVPLVIPFFLSNVAGVSELVHFTFKSAVGAAITAGIALLFCIIAVVIFQLQTVAKPNHSIEKWMGASGMVGLVAFGGLVSSLHYI